LKAQVVVDYLTGSHVCTAFDKGCRHDFRLFKVSQLPTQVEQLWVADRGYQGLLKLHTNSCTPVKKSRHQKRSQQDRQYNRQLAQVRIAVEHVCEMSRAFSD
jgi:hypothetical protein